ncbi:amidase signature domain-containing protein [Dactylonectria macrodidyma]|uniref:Amidase signature domain-containing protein n=1 Tax=Dactylonectria macrodidyma TaxID=307937 RepID=A0A9P9DXC1_9HYPO|nr:amidase signature domain-containing protein [Dactylonectria macrodidyma]
MDPATLTPPSTPWQETMLRKKCLQANLLAAGLAEIEETTDICQPSVDVTNITDASKVVDLIKRGELTCTSITKAFIRRAVKTHDQTNCLTEVAFQDALSRAAKLDEYFSLEGKLFGPLHGVVVTLKDQFDLKGYDTTLGYVGRAFCPAKEDAVLVKILRSLGAIVIAKSNLPQSILWSETENPLWGLTTHPFHKGYTPGGSTGGEAALLACGASLLGWGTDIGGSIRNPAHMLGLYGLKPSSMRLPYRGVPVSTEGQEHVPSSVGPLARDLNTIHLAMTSIIETEPWEQDARCATAPWRGDLYNEVQSRPLVIGVLMDDDVVRPHPPISRVMREAVEALRSAGHEILEWNADMHPECINTMDLFYTADGGEDIRTDILKGGEPFLPHVERLINRGKAISVYEYWQLNRRKWELQQAYLEKWNSIRSPKTGRKADIVLMPPVPHASVPHRGCHWVGYTKVWNLLDYTALVIPGGSINSTDLEASWEFDPRGPEDQANKSLWEEHKTDMASLGLPVGLQIIGRKLEEEKVLGAGKVVDDVVRKLRGMK